MPELPEVESAARELDAAARGARVADVERLDDPRLVETPDAATFAERIQGLDILGVRRRAKWILVMLSKGYTLAIHLRMTGDVGVFPAIAEADKHTHLVLALEDGRRLFFRDPRKFGRVRLLDPSGLAALEAAHGLEPLEAGFTREAFAAAVARATRIKPLLLDQSRVAGLGNIYADEALWEAGIHPLRPGKGLTEDEVTKLHQAIPTVLERALAQRGGPWRYYQTGFNAEGERERYLNVYDRAGAPCARCGTAIARLVVAGRGTHVCPRCQVAPEG